MHLFEDRSWASYLARAARALGEERGVRTRLSDLLGLKEGERGSVLASVGIASGANGKRLWARSW